ncbi:MAG: CRISPR-associated endoribonuclease Cas6 [Anaerolineae bacterium]
MRLLLDLRARGDFAYDSRYHSKLQGLIYRFLLGSGYGELHDLRGYKFFTFSNPFPIPRDLRVPSGHPMHLIVASPSEDVIRRIYGLLLARYVGHEVHVGEMSLELTGVRMVRSHVGWGSVIVTSTPVVVRIPEPAYERFEVPPEERRPGFIYWRPRAGIRAFLGSVELNLLRKFSEFHGWAPRVDPALGIFEIAKPVRAPIPVRIPMEGGDVVVVGSTWRFYFTSMDPVRRRLLEFALDAGIGERNSMGFGFLNVMRRDQSPGERPTADDRERPSRAIRGGRGAPAGTSQPAVRPYPIPSRPGNFPSP